jgi:signal transduction histidine kinase
MLLQGLWVIFPSTFFFVKLGIVDINTEEWMWTVFDFMGKVMFSSSLLQGNFLTIEQRRLIAMRIVEEGNRIQVIQELKDLVEQKERFMSSMSHELRTPLNGIIGLSDALLVGSCGQINEMAHKTITTIKTSGSRLLNLINDILDAASMGKVRCWV